MLRIASTLAVSSLLLTGCRTAGGGCPPLVSYSVPTQRAAAAALRAMPRDSAVARMIVDYGKMRDACRVSP